MPEPNKAVFLSYASQDAEAARRIAEALRVAGIEVWFDQSELRGGDAWDQKLRKQIKECALFVPIISANTQARAEGYFRLEWRLADQRTHLMGKSKAFLVPVCIDDTSDADADVPDSFLAVQWMRHSGGAVDQAFVDRIASLFQGAVERPSAAATSNHHPGGSPAPVVGAKRNRWIPAAAAIALAIAGVALFWKPWQGSEFAEGIPHSSSPDPAPLSQARQLVKRARELMNKVNVLPAELSTAAGMLEQAARLAPNDALVWSTWTLLDLRYVALDYDNSTSRHNAARTHAARANALDPASRETRYVQAAMMRNLSREPATLAAAEEILRPMLTEAPDDGRVLIQLGWLANSKGQRDEAIALWDRAVRMPAVASEAAYSKALALILRNQFDASDHAYDEFLALEPTSAQGLCGKGYLSAGWRGDLDEARDLINRIPPQMRVEDMSAFFGYTIFMFRREYDQAVQAIRAVPRDYLSAQPGPGPSGFYVGDALAAADRSAAAAIEWRNALTVVERRLAETPGNRTLMEFKALLLARLGDRTAGEQVWKTVVELYGDSAWGYLAPHIHVQFLPPDEAIAWLSDQLTSPQYWFTAATLRLNPLYDPLRTNPQFTALVEKMEADPRFSPKAKQTTDDGRQRTENGGQTSDSVLPATRSSPALSSPNGLLTTAPDKSVAVLAFENMSGDGDNEYFSDGISEELLNVLAKVPGMRVTARSSSFYFKGRNVPVAEVAQQLGVAYIVEGSVRKQGARVRISAQLIKAADGFNVWSDTFNRDLKDIFAVQDEIAGLIAEQMQLKLGVTQRAQVVDPEAHRLLLEARFYWNQRGEQNFDRTETLLNQALARDPDFAPAHAAMADLWAMRAAYRATGGSSDVSSELSALQASVSRALELDPALVEPYGARAYGLMMEGKWDESEQWFGRALALRPDDPTVRLWHAILLMNRGDLATAAGEFQDARRLDPFSFAIAQLNAECLLTLRRTGEAIELLQGADALRPGGFLPAQGKRAALLWQAGQNEEAVALARKVRQSWPAGPRWDADAQSLWVLKQSGLEDEVAAYSAVLLRELPADSVQRGWVLSVLDRVDEALPFLEHLSSLNRFYLANTPLVDSWRDDPRFREMLRRLNWESEYERARSEMPGAVSKP